MSQPPRIVVGLGNPGPEYAGTRHNAGFWLAELIARELGVELRRESRFHGFVGHVREAGLWILMPQTYMNRSGQSVLALANFYRILPDRILVLHDELDIPPGQLRLKFGGGLGGHNGLKDIVAHLGTQDFWRLRIGIGHPGDRDEVVNYVLKPARAEEQTEIDRSLTRALDLWPLIARGEWERAIQRANARPAPPAPPASNRPESQP
jgi:PTH1 family peptidyl-tRNA hydrolase